MKGAWFALIFTGLFAAAEAGPLPALPFPPAISSSQYSWQQTGITAYGLQPDGLKRYGFDFTMTNTGTTPLVNVYDIMPGDPVVNFGITNGVWNSALKEWTAMTAAGLVVAKPYNIAGFLDPSTPQYPVFAIAQYLAPGKSANAELQFEFSPPVGYFAFDAYLAAVPEPASLGLVLSGVIGLGWFAYRRRRAELAA